MSLNWDATKASDWNKLESSKQESVIFATMFVDMGEITTANLEEFYKRYTMFNTVTGSRNYLTLEDLRKAVGLHTNVYTTTKAAFKKRLVGILERHADDVIYRERREVADA